METCVPGSFFDFSVVLDPPKPDTPTLDMPTLGTPTLDTPTLGTDGFSILEGGEAGCGFLGGVEDFRLAGGFFFAGIAAGLEIFPGRVLIKSKRPSSSICLVPCCSAYKLHKYNTNLLRTQSNYCNIVMHASTDDHNKDLQ